MQINLDDQEKVLISVIMEDIIQGSRRLKDKPRRKYAQKLQNKFALNTSIIHCKLNDLILMTNLLNEAINFSLNEKVEDKDQKIIQKTNAKLMIDLYKKLTDIIEVKTKESELCQA